MIGLKDKLKKSCKIQVKNIEYIKPILTSHNAGLKRVAFTTEDLQSNVIQIAYGCLNKGESVENHTHPTMEEFFFILSGRMVLIENSIELEIKKGDFIVIPANTNHSLKAITSSRFCYWGVKM